MRFSWLLIWCFALPRGYHNDLSPVKFDKFYTGPPEHIGKDNQYHNPVKDAYLKQILGFLQNEQISIIERSLIAEKVLQLVNADNDNMGSNLKSGGLLDDWSFSDQD